MKTKSLFRAAQVTLLLAALLHVSASAQSMPNTNSLQHDNIAADFKTPVEDNGVWCYWYWMQDDISKGGITRDLLAMKEVGIGTAMIGNIFFGEEDGPVPIFSEQWWDCMVHAVNEGKRIGVDIGVFNGPGWSMAGGPWINAEKAMRYVTHSQVDVQGPGMITQKLKQPTGAFSAEYQDLYVLAFPKVNLGQRTLNNENTKITVTPSLDNPENWIDDNPGTWVNLDPKKGDSYTIEFKAKFPINARSITLYPGSDLLVNCQLYAEQNGDYKLVKKFKYDRRIFTPSIGPIPNGPVAISFPEISSDKFKLVINDVVNNSGFTQISLSEKAVVENYIEKQLGKMHPTPSPIWGSYLWDRPTPVPEALALPVKKVIDITGKMSKDGTLSWQVPAGQWTVMRFGMTPTGAQMGPTSRRGRGFEVDKLNAETARFHFDNYVGKFLERIPEENRSALKYVVADSYEQGSQNWSDEFEQHFEAKFGYNPRKWLPVVSGVVVGSADESDRFLWDLRRAVADDLAYKFVAGYKKACNDHGLKLWLENYGHFGFPGEFLMYGGQSDLVAGEYWTEGGLGGLECKAASSCAHIYGKKRCFAEAFTSAHKAYLRHPATLKARGDWSQTLGINHYVLHLFIQQPDDGRIPGINRDFGAEFNRNNTWFKLGKYWLQYLRRCQQMLQLGNYVADVCYFISESTPKMTGTCDPELPAGYSYDFINAEIIIRDMTVKNGRLVLPHGMSYKMMVLPPLDTIRPGVLAKLEELVKQGAAIYGPRPVASPSLQDYPNCDNQVKYLADRLWGKGYTNGKLSRRHGKGYMFNEIDIQKALDEIKVAKDFDLQERNLLEDESILWTHRKMSGMDIYFISNQTDKTLDVTAQFRVKGVKPQLWDAVTGDIRALRNYQYTKQGCSIPMKLYPSQSHFVVFSADTAKRVDDFYASNFPKGKKLKDIDGLWRVDFLNKKMGPPQLQFWDKLIDWSQSDNELIRYYSGTAIYDTEFVLDKLPADNEIFINLGQVDVIAEVHVNGKLAGGTWIYPYTLNITDLVKKGKNTLEIKVVNLWRNRLYGDNQLPPEKRYTTPLIFHDANKLENSGLIGPVSLESIKRQ